MPVPRHRLNNPQFLAEVRRRLAAGETDTAIARAAGIAPRRLREWLEARPEGAPKLEAEKRMPDEADKLAAARRNRDEMANRDWHRTWHGDPPPGRSALAKLSMRTRPAPRAAISLPRVSILERAV